MFYNSLTKFALYFSLQTDSWNESQLFLHSLTQNEIGSLFWAITSSWLAFRNLYLFCIYISLCFWYTFIIHSFKMVASFFL
jgi:hypothetical protein